MPSVALAQGFGRIGCFLAGCCYGEETDSPIGIVFHESAYAPNGVNLIPTQLISSGLDFLHFLVLIWLARRVKADGQVAGCYLIFYSVGRFILEFFRGDMIRGNVGVSVHLAVYFHFYLPGGNCNGGVPGAERQKRRRALSLRKRNKQWDAAEADFRLLRRPFFVQISVDNRE